MKFGLIILGIVLMTVVGCRRNEDELQWLEQEVSQDAAQAVMDSLEQAEKTGAEPVPGKDSDFKEPLGAVADSSVAQDSLIDDISGYDSGAFENRAVDLPTQDSILKAEPPDEATSAEVEIPPEGTIPVSSGSASRYIVIVGSYAKAELAEAKAALYRESQFPASVRLVMLGNKEFYRVVIGGFQTGAEAKSVGEEIREKLGLEYWIGESR